MKETKQTQLSASGIGKGARVPVAFTAGNEIENVPIKIDGTRAEIAGWEVNNGPAWDILGSSGIDATYESDAVVLGNGLVRFKTPGGWETVPYVGPPFSCESGGKGMAATDLRTVAEKIGAARVPGGGLVNSTEELARLRTEKRLLIRLRAINASASWPELKAKMTGLKVQHVPLGVVPLSLNLVLTNGCGPLARWILKSPAPPPASLNGEWDRVARDENSRASVLLLNSARPEELVRAAVLASLQHGTRIYSPATASVPVDARIKLLLPNSRVTQFSLDEFADLAEALGIACPCEERLTAVRTVGEAVAELVQSLPFPARDLAVTMGGAGMVVYDSRKGCICHLGLSQEGLAATRTYLRRDLITGIGDRTFSALVLAYETVTVAPECSRIVRAARQAWADVLRGSGSFLQPKPTWFEVSVLACECFGTKWIQLPLAHVGLSNVNWPEQGL